MGSPRNDFIRDIIDDDLRTGRYTKVATRFPPEPNGYLHIGHAKSICLNFGIAQDYQGTCNLRYDDTNPVKEDVEYVDSIEKDVRWLGFAPTAVLFSGDYFAKMYELAERLVTEGKAYVCDLDDEQIREYRGTLSEPGRPSPFRTRSPDENLALLRKMKAGELPDGACTLRAKIDMASANMKMRDPLLYRIRHAHHHRTGDAWVIYPMYDWAHPLEDAIESITHSICTLEFENNRELYDWVIDNTGPWPVRPHQYEFARLSLEYTVMSKRKLLTLVQGKHVTGWDDPRMPTIAAMRRRGYSAEALRAFADMIGVAKANSFVDIGKLEYCVRDDLNKTAPRVLGVLRPIEVELVGASVTTVDAPYFPPDVGKPGSRTVPIGTRLLIDREDWRDDPPAGYQRLAPGRTVRLRYGPCITVTDVVERDAAGHATKLRATVHPETLGGHNPSDGRKVFGVIHWVDAATSVAAEVRIYDRLFRTARPEEGGGDFLEHIDRDSLQVVTNARVEASLANAEVGSRWQLERVGYFVVDADSTPGALVLNRIITLRDERVAATSEKSPSKAVSETLEKRVNAKAATRPKSKSPAEYRTEARNRDAELAAVYGTAQGLGLSDEQADLVSGDIVTARLFRDAASATNAPELVAKWVINELPRALGAKPLADSGLDATRFAELIALLRDSTISATVGKTVLAQMVATGRSAHELVADVAATPAADLTTAIEAVIAANPDKAAQYKAGKTGLLGFFVGQVMKNAPGADASAVNSAMRERLG
ncbi:MAG TPA: glutamine--tRNA ligase/YqeY domain fusion protein [Kofleriaceae bacterium]|nr:glutamine--tRNA ligase/YqeY domain fusion protein [Kofleriaceae bacterium]